MKKTLNAFIKQSPQSKKSETFVDNNPQARSNPYEPEMSIREAVEVSTTEYEFTHGKPRGSAGGWMFGKHKSVNFDKHKEGEDYVTIKGVHTYGEAKKKAKTWAAEKGHALIHVLPESVDLQEGPVWDGVSLRAKQVAQSPAGRLTGHALQKGYPAYTVGSSMASGWTKEPKASTNRKIANTIDSTLSGNSGEVAASSRTASGKIYRGLQRGAGVLMPSARVSANAGAAEYTQRMANKAAQIAASKAAGRTALTTGLKVARVAGRLAPWVTAGMAAYDATKGYTAQPNAPVSRKIRNAAQNVASGLSFGIVPAPQGVNENWLAKLALQGIKKVTPIAKRATAALEKKVATKAAQADGSNVVKLVPKAPPKVSVSTPRDATVLNMPKTTIGRAIVKAKAAKPATPATPKGVEAKALNTTGKIKKAFTGDFARGTGASFATTYGIDAATPSHYTEPGKDPSMAPSGLDLPSAAVIGGGAILAGKSRAAWKMGGALGALSAGIGEIMQRRAAKKQMSTPEYKKADADWREYYRKTGQQPK